MRPVILASPLSLLCGVALAGTFQQPLSTRSYDRGAVVLEADGSERVRVRVTDAGGKLVDLIDVTVPVSGAITDSHGNVLAASVPAAIGTTRTSHLAAIDSAIDGAAAAGKFAR
jgi:hypothetical protein